MIAPVLAMAALAGHPHGAAPAAEVTMPGQRFAPSRTTVLLGEEVAWRNLDSSRHTVSAQDRSFDSGAVQPGGEFVHRFTRAGSHPYVCRLHRTMRGTVEVASLALTGPEEAVEPGERTVLEGRGPEGTGTVVLERDGAGVAEATADASGAFRFEVVADAPATYRARSGDLSSGSVRVGVAPRVHLEAVRRGTRVRAGIHVDPPQPGARVVLERHERERFGYVRLRAVTLDSGSRARVVLRTGRRLRLRARLAVPVGGYSRSTGNVVVVPRTGSARPGGPHH